MKIKDLTSITNFTSEIIIFVPSKYFNSDKQNPCNQFKKYKEKYTPIYDPRFYPNGPKMETSELEVHLIEPDIYEYDIPALNVYTK